MTTQKLCPNCFQKGTYLGGRCEKCGYVKEDRPQCALPDDYVLGQHYAVGRVITQDDVMITYLAQDLRTEKIYALPEYFPAAWAVRSGDGIHVKVQEGANAESFQAGMDVLENEAKIIRALSEETILAETGDFLRKNDTAYLLMEYISGETIEEYITRTGEPIPCQQAGQILRSVARTIEDLHKLGLLHRGIGPDSIWILQDGTVKMLDFEATKQYVLSEINGAEAVMKEGFAPSEQYAGPDGQGTWTDVYALAAVYYYMITGVKPISAIERSKGTLLSAANVENKDIPERISNMLKQALAVMYWERIQTMPAFVEALDAAEGTPKMDPYLRLKVGDEMRQWKIEPNRDIRVGRSGEDCEIVVDGDNVSRLHCMIHYDKRKNIFLVKDMSANGTFTVRGLIGRGRVAEVVPGERIYLVSNRYEIYLEVK